jgi:hypothetical protein
MPWGQTSNNRVVKLSDTEENKIKSSGIVEKEKCGESMAGDNVCGNDWEIWQFRSVQFSSVLFSSWEE